MEEQNGDLEWGRVAHWLIGSLVHWFISWQVG